MAKRRSRHSGCVYNRGSRSAPNFWIKWRGEDGSWHYEGGFGSDKARAEARLAVITLGLDTPQRPQHGKGAAYPTLSSYAKTWLSRRMAPGHDGKPMIRSWKDDRARLYHYIEPFAGQRPLDELQSPSWVKEFIAHVRAQLAAQSIRNCLNVISRIFNDWNEEHADDGMDLKNPVSRLDRATRRAIGPKWDPKMTPFIKTKEQIRDVFLALPELSEATPWRAMFAVGVLAGLRTGEVRALRWGDVDFANSRIHVQRSAEGGVAGPLKDNESRVVPMNAALSSVLKTWKRISQCDEEVFPSTGRRGTFVKEHNMHAALRKAEEAVGITGLSWYQSTRHTYASYYVMDGGELAMLAERLGHTTTEVTERYAHLQADRITDKERGLVDIDLLAPGNLGEGRRSTNAATTGRSPTTKTLLN
jgi:integrase